MHRLSFCCSSFTQAAEPPRARMSLGNSSRGLKNTRRTGGVERCEAVDESSGEPSTIPNRSSAVLIDIISTEPPRSRRGAEAFGHFVDTALGARLRAGQHTRGRRSDEATAD